MGLKTILDVLKKFSMGNFEKKEDRVILENMKI